MKKNTPQLLKGFRDYLPQDQIARRKIVSKITEVYELFGFDPIDTPSLESYELFKGQIGEDEKLMYKFQDLGGREVALRYDLTVPLARLVASNPDLPKPFKRYVVGNSWRAENTQKGRFREFTQCDIDIVGSESVIADVEVIAAMAAAFKALEIGDVLVKFNNRNLVDGTLKELGVAEAKITLFMRWLDKLDKIGIKKLTAGLEAEGFKKDIIESYSKIVKEKSKDYIRQIEELLGSFGVLNFEFDPYLMRGLDYYTGIVFEFVLKEKPEFGSIGGGGRYDGLIEKISGVEVPAIGGSIGLDRMFAALQDSSMVSPQSTSEVLVMNVDKNTIAECLNIATNLREAGIKTEFYFETSKIDKQFKYAEKKNIKIAVIFGATEAKKNQVSIKDLTEKKQVTVDMDELITQVKSMLW
ncbi:MAG: histidine--tRNA ligase [Candidatus Doudnabacteria bacterium]|nr:histidine--tRNA ligase [Candidatus Doudnabacteria bacterium]